MQTDPTHMLVILNPADCYHCREDFHNYRVTVESIEQHKGVGWKLRGKGRVEVHCRRCRAIYSALQTAIPIECQNYACPDCGELQSLKYKVQRIDAAGGEFSFEAEISCAKCHKRKTFVEVLKEIFKLKKVEIKITGISFER
jgi:5-methylcytosine-specific restriction endonuclease McrA